MLSKKIIINELSIFFKISSDSFNEKTIASEIPDWNSLTHAELIIHLENKFNFEFNLDELMKIDNVGDLIKIIQKKHK